MDFVDTQVGVDHTPIVLVDRTGDGFKGIEYQFCGGRAIGDWAKRTGANAAGQSLYSMPTWVAVWFLKGDKGKVWTTEGEFTYRFGLAEPTDELVGKLGHAVIITDPITIDTSALEGWDTRGTERTGPGTQIRLTGAALREAKMAMRERIGGAPTPAFTPR
jgi:hypothetical protein